MRLRGWIGAGLLLVTVRAWALGERRYVSSTPVQGGFVLYTSGKVAPLVVSDADWPGVVRAVGDLSADVGRVTDMRRQSRRVRARLDIKAQRARMW